MHNIQRQFCYSTPASRPTSHLRCGYKVWPCGGHHGNRFSEHENRQTYLLYTSYTNDTQVTKTNASISGKSGTKNKHMITLNSLSLPLNFIDGSQSRGGNFLRCLRRKDLTALSALHPHMPSCAYSQQRVNGHKFLNHSD